MPAQYIPKISIEYSGSDLYEWLFKKDVGNTFTKTETLYAKGVARTGCKVIDTSFIVFLLHCMI